MSMQEVVSLVLMQAFKSPSISIRDAPIHHALKSSWARRSLRVILQVIPTSILSPKKWQEAKNSSRDKKSSVRVSLRTENRNGEEWEEKEEEEEEDKDERRTTECSDILCVIIAQKNND